MRKQKIGYLEALRFAQSKRSCVHPNQNFTEQLREYEREQMESEAATP